MNDFEAQVIERLKRIETAAKFHPGWISGYLALGRYLGWNDQSGRKVKAWVEAENIYTKYVNGTPSWRIADIDKAMRNGKRIELPKPEKKKCEAA